MQAMTQFNKYKNIATAGVFAQKYIALGVGKPDAVERVRGSFEFVLTSRLRRLLHWLSEIRVIQLRLTMINLLLIRFVLRRTLRFIRDRHLCRILLLERCISQSIKDNCVVSVV